MPGHVADLLAEGGEMVADCTAMDERGVDPGEIADDVTVLSGESITQRIRDADHTLDF
jgi:predicted peroxiredoxin